MYRKQINHAEPQRSITETKINNEKKNSRWARVPQTGKNIIENCVHKAVRETI